MAEEDKINPLANENVTEGQTDVSVVKQEAQTDLSPKQADAKRTTENMLNQVETPAPQTSNNIITPETKEMEVHKHPHHVMHKKKWGEYLLEFFMLFLAVFLGFVAENIRENIGRNERGEQLIVMMREDLKSDLQRLDSTIKFNDRKLNKLDTFRLLIYASGYNRLPDTSVQRMYYFFRYYGGNIFRYSPVRRTLNQLDKNDGFSLIRKQEVSDSIDNYFSAETSLQSQMDAFQSYQIDALHIGESVFNTELLENFKRRESEDIFMRSTQKFELLTQDKQTLFLYGNKLYVASGVLLNYISQLQQQKLRAEKLLILLKKEYQLKNE